MANFCSNCGTALGEGVNFCPKCGQATTAVNSTSGPGNAPWVSAEQGEPPGPGAAAAQAMPLQPNIAAALAYLWFPTIVWLLLPPYNKDKLIRFHSFQALSFGFVVAVSGGVIHELPFLGGLLAKVWFSAATLVVLYCMVQAFEKKFFKLPVFGEIAETLGK